MTIYINLDDGRASTSSSEFLAPSLFATQGSPLTVDLRFHDGGTVRALAVADLPYLILQLASANGGSPPRVIGGAGVLTGSGTSSTYRCSLVCDNAQMRADFAASSVPLIYDLQAVWREPLDQEKRRTQGIVVNVDVARDLPNTNTPNPVSELDDPDQYVGNRAVRYDESQTLTSEEQAQALENLGLSNTLSYAPGTVAVNPSQVPGYLTATTLQGAFDHMAADATLHTIRFIDDTGVSGARVGTITAITRATITILGGVALEDVDLSAAVFDTLTTDCSFGTLTLIDEASSNRDISITALSPIGVTSLVARGTHRNSTDTFVAKRLYVRGSISCDETNLSGIDGQDTNGLRHGGNGRCIDVSRGSYVGALNMAGGEGADGDVGDMGGNGGNGGYPGHYTAGPLCAIDFAGGVLSVGGDGGAGTGGGSSGASHVADDSYSITVHGSAFVTP